MLILNVATGKISPQYHLVFDDMFSTVNSLPTEDSIEDQWACMFKLDIEFYLDMEYDKDGKLVTSDWPQLSTEWLVPKEKGIKTILSYQIDMTAPGGAPSDEVIQAPEGSRSKDGPAQNTRSRTAPPHRDSWSCHWSALSTTTTRPFY